VIDTWDLTEIVTYGGMEKIVSADSDPVEAEERAPDVALEN
jgi:hypothetical protein